MKLGTFMKTTWLRNVSVIACQGGPKAAARIEAS
jgi:hypothetical protein